VVDAIKFVASGCNSINSRKFSNFQWILLFVAINLNKYS